MIPQPRIAASVTGLILWAIAGSENVPAQVEVATARPVPLMQALPLPYQQVSFQRDGAEICRYHFGPTLRRPFVYPAIGPSGRSLTRMGHPRDPESHSHHNSIWISHNDVNGLSFWSDRSHGRIVHQRIERFEDAEGEALLVAHNAWLNETNNKVLLLERRCLRVQPLPHDEWLLILDLELRSTGQKVILGKTPFGLMGVRMAKTIGIHDGGGLLRNSEGAAGEKEIFWKRARWVDYSGPITASAMEGVMLLDHPANPNHPTAFHVRGDGWMGASLTLEEPRTIEPDGSLKLRYGCYIHAGVPTVEALQERWNHFAKIGPPPGPSKD